jgi:hypothetical protein
MAEEALNLPGRFGAANEQILGAILGYDKATIERWRAEEILA